MKRKLVVAALLLCLSACSSGPERGVTPPPLPDKVSSLPYSELLTRSRALAARATELTYVGNWEGLQEAARGLDQTAEYLAKATDVPPKHADTIKTVSADMRKQSRELIVAASTKNDKKTDEVLGRINRLVREMRLGE